MGDLLTLSSFLLFINLGGGVGGIGQYGGTPAKMPPFPSPLCMKHCIRHAVTDCSIVPII